MAKQESDKDKHKDKPKAKPPAPSAQDQAKEQAKKEKAKAKAAADAAEKEKADAAEKEKPKAAPRPPADPRMKYYKKFHGKFLPRGPLRDRLKALMQRWDSGEDRGGVTVEELKSLHEDWKADRAKRKRPVPTSG